MDTDGGARTLTAEAAVSRARRVRRIESGGAPFIPWGLVPAIGLVLVLLAGLIPFAQAGVEDAAERAAQQALNDSGAVWARARASGQWIILEGDPPSTDAADAAIAAVRAAKAATVLGVASPVTRVSARFAQQDAFGAAPIAPESDELVVVDPEPRAPAPELLPGPAVAPSIPVSPEVVACESRLATLLESARIEFATGSAVIRTSSARMLDLVAATAKTCPGVLRIEGHTDNVGEADMNRELSLQRAEAVRAALIRRGLQADRLVAEGRGDAQPSADNTTEAGRSRNRRIEIRVMDAPT